MCTEQDADRSAEERAATTEALQMTRLMTSIAIPRMKRNRKSLEVVFDKFTAWIFLRTKFVI
jgi:hypothetical protein